MFSDTDMREIWSCCVVSCGCSRGDSCPGGRTEWLMIHIHRWSQFALAPGEHAIYGCCRRDQSNINWMMWNLTFAKSKELGWGDALCVNMSKWFDMELENCQNYNCIKLQQNKTFPILWEFNKGCSWPKTNKCENIHWLKNKMKSMKYKL